MKQGVIVLKMTLVTHTSDFLITHASNPVKIQCLVPADLPILFINNGNLLNFFPLPLVSNLEEQAVLLRFHKLIL